MASLAGSLLCIVPALSNLVGIGVPFLYLVTFKFSFVQHCVPICNVLYVFPSISFTVGIPEQGIPVTLFELVVVNVTSFPYAVPALLVA